MQLRRRRRRRRRHCTVNMPPRAAFAGRIRRVARLDALMTSTAPLLPCACRQYLRAHAMAHTYTHRLRSISRPINNIELHVRSFAVVARALLCETFHCAQNSVDIIHAHVCRRRRGRRRRHCAARHALLGAWERIICTADCDSE